jgi:hypothetical protein
MLLYHDNAATARPSQHFALPPYHVEEINGLRCVCNKNGFNCLSFTDAPGAKFTSKKTAEAIVTEWNK